MFAHKHGPGAPVFTVVMAALGYSTNRPSMFLSRLQRRMFVLLGRAITFVPLTWLMSTLLVHFYHIQFNFLCHLKNKKTIRSIQKVLFCSYVTFFFPSVCSYSYFPSPQVTEVQMHESGSEPRSHTIPASQTENGNNTENESRLRSSQTPPPEAPRVSHSSCIPLRTSALVLKVLTDVIYVVLSRD